MYKQRDIEVLWNQYTNLLNKLEDKNISKLIENMDQRILLSSYSQKEKEPFCGIGGLVDYSINLVKKSNSLMKDLNYDLNKASIIKCCLLSILGRVGTLSVDRFIETKSDWHKDKLGQYYEWNESCPKYQVNDMTLFMLQFYKVHLSWDEWQAISLLGNITSENNKFYGYYKSRLSLVLQTAHEIVMKDEKDNVDGLYTIPF